MIIITPIIKNKTISSIESPFSRLDIIFIKIQIAQINIIERITKKIIF